MYSVEKNLYFADGTRIEDVRGGRSRDELKMLRFREIYVAVFACAEQSDTAHHNARYNTTEREILQYST